MIALGTKARLEWIAEAQHCIHLASDRPGGVVVFATPAMINLMEHAARNAIAPYLASDEESVGATVNIEHLAATPLGAKIVAEAIVTAVDGRLVDFAVTAFDALGPIGRGTHRRAIVNIGRVAQKLAEKVRLLPEHAMTPSPMTPDPGPLPALATLAVSVQGAIATITLNRPNKLNAVNVQMTADWERLNAWLAGHPAVRVAIVTGAGTAFCAGDDVPEVGTLPLEVARELSWRQARMYLSWERLPQVFIAAINGPALGAGCVAAYSCDFRLATHVAKLGMPEVKLGWPPGYGIAQLTALVGKARALELCLLGDSITAAQAQQFGLVHDVVSMNRLLPAAQELAEKMLALPAVAIRETKRLIHGDEGAVPKSSYLNDTAAYIRCLEQPDAQEGIQAFREKRVPKFRGT